MGQDKVLVIGHSPGKTPIYKMKNGSPTLNRLNRWLDACEVDIYSFTNLCAHHKEFLKMADIDGIFIQKITKNYNKIITLGGFVSQYVTKIGVPHFAAPHPSPRNRKFNDKSYEPKVIKQLKEYLL
jgi:hypothetical protein|tara:strand:+ start:622 stop:999 length:378 start_codon:yes stop_codon:yes gene_type:complete